MDFTTVRTRVLVISDTHGAPLSKRDGSGKPLYPPFKSPLPTADLLVHCGDMTYTGSIDEFNATLDMLKEIDAPVKLVIAGNHDVSLDRDFVLDHIGKRKSGWKRIENKEAAEAKVKEARDFWSAPSGRAQLEGVTYLEEGLHRIELQNGAKVSIYASPYTPEFHDFGFAYKKYEDCFNPPEVSFIDAMNIAKSPVPSFSSTDPVDFMIVHGPPYGRLDETARGDHVGCPHLLKALTRNRPLICCFGHIHEGWGAERIQWSSTVEESANKRMSTDSWKQGGWHENVAADTNSIESIRVDRHSAKKQHSAFLDLLDSSGNGLRRGKETILINASIMDLKYNPVNAPWLLYLDLPRDG